MVLYGVLAMLCLVAGFGLAWYEHDLRWQIVNALHRVRPDLEPFALFARAGSLRRSEVLRLYRAHCADGDLVKRSQIVLLAAPACFLFGAALLVLAFTRSQ